MNEENGKKLTRPITREERLATKLRENLRRRKAQGRELKAELGDNRVPKEKPES